MRVQWQESAWPTALPTGFGRREVASPTAFEKKKKKNNYDFEDDKIVNLCDQKQEKELAVG